MKEGDDEGTSQVSRDDGGMNGKQRQIRAGAHRTGKSGVPISLNVSLDSLEYSLKLLLTNSIYLLRQVHPSSMENSADDDQCRGKGDALSAAASE